MIDILFAIQHYKNVMKVIRIVFYMLITACVRGRIYSNKNPTSS